ncbi:MAG: hypothetical protein PHQ03_10750 [Methylococcales bacterium]|nr:hypothetical protein [Methylococcales bacterium]
MQNFKKCLTPLLITSVLAALLPLAFFIGFFLGNDMPIKITLEKFNSVAAGVSAIATVIIALLTIILAIATWLLRKDQMEQLAELKSENIRPNITIQLESSPVDVHFMNVKISNFGKGIAKNVIFEFLDREGNQIQPEQNEYAVIEKFKTLAIFRRGVKTIGINQVISSFMFNILEQYQELKGDKPCLNIIIRFEDVEGISYESSHVIDFADFDGMSKLNGEYPLHEIAKDIKKISEHIISERIGVDVFNATDRSDEEERRKKLYEEYMK